jgi:uncharacterized protein (TIGR02246 family)
MVRKGICLVLTSLVSVSCGARLRMTDVERLQMVESVHAAVHARFETMNRHDANAVAAFYRDGEAFVYAGVSDVIEGGQNFRAMTAPWYSLHRDQTFEYSIVSTQILSPDIATVTIRGSTSAAPHLLWTDVMVLEDGRWMVALEHESWPGAPEPSVHPATP